MARNNIGDLSVTLFGNTEAFNKNIAAALQNSEKFGNAAKSHFGNVEKSVTGLINPMSALKTALGGLIAYFTVNKIVEFSTAMIGVTAKMDDFRSAAGLTAEEVGKLQNAGERAGITFDELQGDIFKFQKQMLNAKDGTSEVSVAFKQLGLDASKGLSANIFVEAIKRVNEIPDALVRAEYQTLLFGKSGASAFTRLIDFTDVWGQAVSNVTEKDLANADQHDKNMKRRIANLQSYQFAISNGLLKTFEALTSAMDGTFGKFDVLDAKQRETFSDKVTGWAKTFSVALLDVAVAITKMTEKMMNFVQLIAKSFQSGHDVKLFGNKIGRIGGNDADKELARWNSAESTSERMRMSQSEIDKRTAELTAKANGGSETPYDFSAAIAKLESFKTKLADAFDKQLQPQTVTVVAKGDTKIEGKGMSDILNLIARGESGGSYNSYNKGTSHGSIIPGGKENLTALTVAEVMARQALPNGNSNRIFAAGKYQITPNTMKDVVRGLDADKNSLFSPELQEKMGVWLLNSIKSFRDYITGKSNDLDAAQLGVAKMFAAVANPYTGKSYYGDGNAASISTAEFRKMATAARSNKGQVQQVGPAAIPAAVNTAVAAATAPVMSPEMIKEFNAAYQSMENTVRQTSSEFEKQADLIGLSVEQQQILNERTKLFQMYMQKNTELSEKFGTSPMFSEKSIELTRKYVESVSTVESSLRKLQAAQAEFNHDWKAGINKSFDDYIRKVDNVNATMESFTTNAIGGLVDALTNLQTDGSASVKTWAANVFKELAKIVIEIRLVEPAIKALKEALNGSSSGGGFGGLLSGVFGAVAGMFGATSGAEDFTAGWTPDNYGAHGLVYSGGFIGSHFAKGGITNRPTTFMTSEFNHPEAVLPLTKTATGELGVRSSGGSKGSYTNAPQYNVNIQISDVKDGTDAGNRASEAFLRGVVREEMRNAKEPGGINNPMSTF